MTQAGSNSDSGGEASRQRSWLGSSLELAARRPGAVALAALALLVVIIVLQNVEPVEIDLLFWSVARVPKLVLILVSMLLGALIWEVARRRLSRRARTQDRGAGTP
jgi:uncharacterized integral membrane protein